MFHSFSAVFVPLLDCEYFEDRAVHYSVWIVLDEQQNLPHRIFDEVLFLGRAVPQELLLSR